MSCGETTSIDSAFLDKGDLFGVQFNQGIVFLEVQSYEQVKYDPYTGVGTVSAGSSTGFNQLQDGSNEDILYIERDKKKVKQAAIGHRPALIRRYTNYPEDENRLRKINNLGAPIAGDDFGYVDGEDSPYEGPTVAEELWVVPNTHLNFAFSNPDNQEHEPVLNIKMREYNVRPLDPDDGMDRNAIKNVMNPMSPMPVVMAGGPNFQIDYDLRSSWGVSPISESNARNIGRNA